MTTNHTPGPWIAQLNQVGADYVHIGTEGPDGVCEVQWNGSAENQESNARLIAAAPEMLEALEALLSYDRVVRPAFRTRPVGAPDSMARIDQDTLIRLEDNARAAINKAKGEK